MVSTPIPDLKPVEWLGGSRDDVRDWPKAVKEEIGTELLSVQRGREPSSWKPMSTIGPGVSEIKVAESGNQYRVIYVAHFPEAIYVLHAFQKKTQKTAGHDIDLAKKRFKELLIARREQGAGS